MPGELTFALNRRLLAGAVTVTDEEVMEAMATAFESTEGRLAEPFSLLPT